MLVSLIAAIVAAVFYGVASVMQAIAVRAASNRDPEDAAAGGDVLRAPVAGRADGDSLHHRGNAITHRRDDRRDEAD